MENKITTAQYEAIMKMMTSMRNTMDLRFEEWSGDRQSITNLDVRLKTVEAKLDGARDDIADSQKKIMNKVDEHLQPMSDIVADAVTDAIGEVKKKKWYQVMKGGSK